MADRIEKERLSQLKERIHNLRRYL